MTKLTKPLVREIKIANALYMVTLTEEHIRFRRKGARKVEYELPLIFCLTRAAEDYAQQHLPRMKAR